MLTTIFIDISINIIYIANKGMNFERILYGSITHIKCISQVGSQGYTALNKNISSRVMAQIFSSQ